VKRVENPFYAARGNENLTALPFTRGIFRLNLTALGGVTPRPKAERRQSIKNITIPEDEYLQIQRAVSDLKKQAELIQHDDFIKKISLIYRLLCERQGFIGKETEKIPLKRGSGQGVITYVAEDFDEPLDDFREYME